jgi:hypothetical protein
MVLDPLKKNDQDDLLLEMVVSSVAPSPLVEPQATLLLPAGFEEVDVTILKWIAADTRRLYASVDHTPYISCQPLNVPAKR